VLCVEEAMKIRFPAYITIAMFVALCSCAAEKRAEQSAPPQNSPRNIDDEVIDVVLNDLLTKGDTPLAVGKEKSAPKAILFSPEPAPFPRKVETILLQHDKKQWEKLSEPQRVAAQEAATDLVSRIKARDDASDGPTAPRSATAPATRPLDFDGLSRVAISRPFAPSDPRVKLFDPTTTTTKPSRFDNRPVYAWRPGFTADQKYAVVSLSIPWSMHHADATYLLEKKGDTWVIVLRQFVYYV
jgi:hypothetical protein